MFEMVRKVITSVEFIYCGCGCGFTRPKRDNCGRLRYYINSHACNGKKLSEEHKKKLSEKKKGSNHPNFGKHLSEKTKQKIGNAQLGELNHIWKDNDVGNSALHNWLRKYLPKPKDGLCEICYEKPFRDVTNITSIYERNFKNWVWACHSCNLVYDNAATKAWITKRKKKNLITRDDDARSCSDLTILI